MQDNKPISKLLKEHEKGEESTKKGWLTAEKVEDEMKSISELYGSIAEEIWMSEDFNAPLEEIEEYM